MAKYFVPTKGVGSWRKLLADPNKQWKEGCSAYELAHCWEYAENLPSCVERVFKSSNIPLFQDVKVLYGFPEYKVSLPGRGKSSHNDLYLLAKANNELLTIMVEGKVYEPFGKEVVSAWIEASPSVGKTSRLASLLDLLNLKEGETKNIKYQLLHRTASSIMEAKKVNANNALMLVHSFSDEGKWFEDYASFVQLFRLEPLKNAVIGPVAVNGVNLYFGWVHGTRVLPKVYFFNQFKTEKARMLAKEIDNYIYKNSAFKGDVWNYHHRYKSGTRSDCISYASKKDSYKFVTITTARNVVFVLDLGKKLHSKTANHMQKEIDELLGRAYEETDRSIPTPGEVYIRLEWVDSLWQISRFIDKAYELRVEK
ncbi:hypothetical protein [Bacillus sp. FJAT-27445]|uniref:DUF6946 family protein n=1 Tax=Bacillus sp. FJAT-27445 TaxID=1679166 RepID=UPI000A4FE7B0|nr:hypothetical protein [Bacillus sp. FJAT-27445]